MDPAVRYTTEDDLIRDVDVDDEGERGVLFPGGIAKVARNELGG